MAEDNLNPSESLQLIESMINRAKNRFSEDGHLYLFWGWMVLLCCIVQFVLIHFFQYRYFYIVWMLTWFAGFYSVFYARRQKKKRKVKNYADEIISYVWMVFLVMALLLSYVIGALSGPGPYYTYIHPIMLTLYGMPVFLSGVILRFNALKIGGIGCWVLAAISPLVAFEYQSLLAAAAMIIAWIRPGYLLREKYKLQESSQ
ncbi:hypothetical protein [Foetidibacter luteolus]|uniref:hypothetical protein n=1 Tax=Foetidibacter luteolus TaxID=2608880 RepID=UPI00129B0303|nr:hypothetical protein [Foetidibacter luteolus]